MNFIFDNDRPIYIQLVEQLKEYMGENEKDSMKRQIAITKAVDFIMANVKEKAKAKPKKETEEVATEE